MLLGGVAARLNASRIGEANVAALLSDRELFLGSFFVMWLAVMPNARQTRGGRTRFPEARIPRLGWRSRPTETDRTSDNFRYTRDSRSLTGIDGPAAAAAVWQDVGHLRGARTSQLVREHCGQNFPASHPRGAAVRCRPARARMTVYPHGPRERQLKLYLQLSRTKFHKRPTDKPTFYSIRSQQRSSSSCSSMSRNCWFS